MCIWSIIHSVFITAKNISRWYGARHCCTEEKKNCFFSGLSCSLHLQLLQCFHFTRRTDCVSLLQDIHTDSPSPVPKDEIYDFSSGCLTPEFLSQRILVDTRIHRLLYSLQFIVVYPGLISSNGCCKETVAHGLILIQKIGTSLHSLLLVMWC